MRKSTLLLLTLLLGFLPALAQGDSLTAEKLEATGHETLPPPRYTEASLVKTLDELGSGRPSTDAAVISTIMDRGYVQVRSGSLLPSWAAAPISASTAGRWTWWR